MLLQIMPLYLFVSAPPSGRLRFQPGKIIGTLELTKTMPF